MNVSKYLERIGYTKKPETTLACLNDLISCQLHSVPFENIDVYCARLVPSLEEDALFDKIVTRHRGGYCFELNTLFCRLLREIGFDAFCVRVRILLDREVLPPQTHCGILVQLDGKVWFCDVGFGGPAPIGAVCLDGGAVFYGNRGYRIVDNILYLQREEGFVPMMEFETHECKTLDFQPTNYFCATSEEEPFVHGLMVSLKLPDGHISISGDVFSEKHGAKVSKIRILSENHAKEILKNYFEIDA